MRLLFAKVIVVIGILAYLQGTIVPWAVSTKTLPLGVIISLILLVAIVWGIAVQYIFKQFLNYFERSKM